MTTQRTRNVASFSWEKVARDLIIDLVVAAAAKIGDEADRATLEGLDAAELRRRATVQLGRPPSQALMKLLVPVLRDNWLATRAGEKHAISAAIKVRLALQAASRPPVPTTRQAALEILSGRRNTSTLQRALRQEFISAHKQKRSVILRSPPKGAKPRFTLLEGAGRARDYEPFEHQREVWRELSRLLATRTSEGIRVALPTGAGKTEAAAEWLLGRMNEDPDARVLWLCHRKELLDQTLRRFVRCAPHQPVGFERRARAVHSAASALSTLTEKQLDIAIVSIDTLARAQRGVRRRRLKTFLARPTYIVVDEMHHAGASGYKTVLDDAFEVGTPRGLVGLSATPLPTGAAAQQSVRARFPTVAITRTVEELVRKKVLAKPTYAAVRTGKMIELSPREATTAERGDLPSTVLSRIGDPARDRLIADTYLKDPRRWGKTLVFAPTIANADALTAAFVERGADARVMHTAMLQGRNETLAWFRGAKEPVVLVSVGMLTEGVDLPDARTAFIARPTGSYILMRQMIGRVLRGTPSGGGAEAHVVYFSDTWRGVDALEPLEVLPDQIQPDGPRPVVEEEEVPPDLVRAIRRMFQAAVPQPSEPETEEALDEPMIPVLVPTALAGYYELAANVRIPVLDHQVDGFQRLIASAKRGGRMPPLLGHFADDQPPLPARRDLSMLIDEVRAGISPPFVDLHAELGARVVAERILRAGEMSDAERDALIGREHRESLAGAVYETLPAFKAAVQVEMADLIRGRINPEQPLSPSPPRAPRLPLVPPEARDLRPMLERVARHGHGLLPPEIAERLGDLPPVEWTAQPIEYAWAYHLASKGGTQRGQAVIRVNRLLCADPAVISDGLLEFLLWHELLHHLLPTQGHDDQFRALEAEWEDSDDFSRELDTLHETWQTKPKAYRVTLG